MQDKSGRANVARRERVKGRFAPDWREEPQRDTPHCAARKPGRACRRTRFEPTLRPAASVI